MKIRSITVLHDRYDNMPCIRKTLSVCGCGILGPCLGWEPVSASLDETRLNFDWMVEK